MSVIREIYGNVYNSLSFAKIGADISSVLKIVLKQNTLQVVRMFQDAHEVDHSRVEYSTYRGLVTTEKFY